MNGETNYGPSQTMAHHIVIKRDEAMTHTTMWMNVEDIMLSERSQIPEVASCIISWIGNVQKRHTRRGRRQTVVAKGWEEAGIENNCYRVYLRVMKPFWN